MERGGNIRPWRTFLLTVLLPAAVLVVTEAAARLVEVLRPDAELAGLERAFSPPPKDPDAFRIFLYGESTVEGFPIRQYGFAAQLEFWLRQLEPGKKLDVHNLGRAAKNSRFVRHAVERTIDAEADLLIVMTGHNEFLLDGEPGLAELARRELALARVLDRAVSKLRSLFAPGQPRHVVAPDPLDPFVRGSRVYQRKVQNYVASLRRIATLARQKGIPLLLLTSPGNLRDWPPVYRNLRRGGHRDTRYEERAAAALALVASGAIAQAQLSVSHLQRDYPDDAMVLYLEGAARAARGDYQVARTLFQRAKDLDPMPWRATHEINDAMREVARSKGAILIDLVAAFEQEAENGLVGFDWISDNVHPTPLGNALITREILAALRTRHLFLEHDLPSWSLRKCRDWFLAQTLDPYERRALDKRYFMHNGLYAMKTPFYNHAASKKYLLAAKAVDDFDWTVWANLSTISLLEDRVEEGRRELRTALALRGGAIDPLDRARTPYLFEALSHSGLELKTLR